MAELFFEQGQPERAAAIYRHVVRERPDDGEALERLAEIEEIVRARRARARSEKPGGAMSFRDHIQRVVDAVPGAMACTIMGFDGIAIDSYEVGGAEIDLQVLLTEYSALVGQVRRAMETQAQSGDVKELAIATTHMVALVQPLTKEYFLAAILKPEALVGKARYLMRVVTPSIVKELS